MGKNCDEDGKNKISALTGYLPSSLRNRMSHSDSKNPVRNKVLAAVVATGAFVAVGSPIVAGAGDEAKSSSETVTPMAAQKPLSAAVNGTPEAPASVELRGAKAPEQHAAKPKIDKSQAMAEKRAKAEAEQKAAQRKAVQEQIKMKKAYAEKAAAQAKKDDAKKAAQAAPAPAPAPKAAEAKASGGKFVDGRLTSGYHTRGGSHAGIDIGADMGTPIYAPTGGKVISSGSASGFGKWVRIEHGGGMVTVYGHIHSSAVSVGDTVKAGEKIATVGSRGQSTGPHLHFEVRHGAGGAETNPIPWLKDKGISID